jgi:hypothetical protein
MRVIPLFLADPPGGSDASHAVAAPGGSEWWRLDGEDQTRGLRLAVTFLDGDFSNPQYRQRYRQYRRRPTRNAPPQPHDFPAIHLRIELGDGEPIEQEIPLRPGELVAAVDRLAIAAGTNSLRRDDSGDVQLHVEQPEARIDLVLRQSRLRGTLEISRLGQNRRIDFDGGGKLEHGVVLTPPGQTGAPR